MRIACLCIAVFCLLFGGWFLYDGLVTFPQDNDRAAKLQADSQRAKAANDLAAAERAEAELATVQMHTAVDVIIQKVLGAGFMGGALALVCIALWPRKKPAPPPLPPRVIPN